MGISGVCRMLLDGVVVWSCGDACTMAGDEELMEDVNVEMFILWILVCTNSNEHVKDSALVLLTDRSDNRRGRQEERELIGETSDIRLWHYSR